MKKSKALTAIALLVTAFFIAICAYNRDSFVSFFNDVYYSGEDNKNDQVADQDISAEEKTETKSESASDISFRNENLLNQHYEKHGIEMGFASAADYEAAAAAVVSNPNALHKTEKEDGDDVYYVEATNEFVVVSTDGYIRTYFLPDSGKKYYDKQ
ncbi:MAG: hypothetical protein K6G57_07310 [Lachnospiraceae bacterium]|nr:hypothetical protein [Lachnospiraceae bacterium]